MKDLKRMSIRLLVDFVMFTGVWLGSLAIVNQTNWNVPTKMLVFGIIVTAYRILKPK